MFYGKFQTNIIINIKCSQAKVPILGYVLGKMLDFYEGARCLGPRGEAPKV
jgi:hypothetical protein